MCQHNRQQPHTGAAQLVPARQLSTAVPHPCQHKHAGLTGSCSCCVCALLSMTCRERRVFILDTSTGKIVTNLRLTEPKVCSVGSRHAAHVRTLSSPTAGGWLRCCPVVRCRLSHHGAPVLAYNNIFVLCACCLAAHAGDCMGPSRRRAQLHVCHSSRHGCVPLGRQPLQRTGELVRVL
jgi:hypothetical protein